jgi:hypothetical protein
VNDGINTLEVFTGGVTFILADMRHHGEIASSGQGAPFVKIAVEGGDLIASAAYAP